MGHESTSQPLHPTRIDLPAEERRHIIVILNQTLVSTLDLKTQVKQAHWNVKGMDFYQLHEMFDELATELEEFIDLFAERITALGGLALGTARMAAAESTLPEYPFDVWDGKDHITALADRYAPYAKLLRDNIHITDDLGDADTADLYTEVSREIDKRLWFLEAHLQGATSSMSKTAVKSNGKASAAAAKANGKTMTAKPKKAKAK